MESQKIKLFKDLFKGREDVYPRMFISRAGKKGYSPYCLNRFKAGCDGKCYQCTNSDYKPLDDSVLAQHLDGKEVIGIYPLLPDETSHFIAADFDNHAGGHDPLKDAKELFEVCKMNEIPCYIERSRSGKGYHAWIFFDAKVPAWKSRLVTFALLKEAQAIAEDTALKSFDRLFPNQDTLNGKKLGNLISLPLQGRALQQGNTTFLDMGNSCKPHQDQWVFLSTVKRVSEDQLDKLIEEWGLKKDDHKPANTEVSSETNQPGLEKVLNCEFIRWCSDNPKSVKEPLWYCMVSNLARFKGGYETIHKFSKDYPTYSEKETDRKVEHALKDTNPHSCSYIQRNGYKCSKSCQVKSPASLAFKNVDTIKKIWGTEKLSGSLTQPISDNEELHKFPAHAMRGVAGDFAKIFSSYLESPKEFFYFAYLTCLGNVLANRLTLESEIAPQPRLYTLTLGESADDRKSTVLKKALDFFRDTFPDFKVCHGVGSAEGLQERLRECSGQGLLLAFDELKAFVSKCKIEASVLLPCVSTLFEDNRYETNTKKKNIFLEDAFLSILSASTVQTYENIFSSQFIDIGFNNRLFIVPASSERKHSIPKKIPQKERDYLKKQTRSVLELVGDFLELTITADAHVLFSNWYLNFPKSVHSKRIDTYALRLMPLLTVNEGKKEVDADIVGKVIAIMDWQLEMRKLHDPIDADNTVARMEERIRRCLSLPLGNRELKRRCHVSRYGIWVFNAALKNLQSAKEIYLDKKTQSWALN